MQIVGHRGARNEAPENTLVGFEHLRSLGIEHVELDVRLSKDNQLVVLHDATLDRTTDHKGKVSNYTAEELQHVNAAYKFKAKSRYVTSLDYTFSEVPTLEKVVNIWDHLKFIQFEVKSTDKRSLERIAERLSFLIEAHQIYRQACITSSDTSMLRIVGTKYRHIKKGFVAERFRRDPIGICISLGCDYLVIDWRACSEAIIEKAHAEGLLVSVWTVNKIDTALRLYEWGADSIITDEPTLMMKTFQHIHHAHIE